MCGLLCQSLLWIFVALSFLFVKTQAVSAEDILNYIPAILGKVKHVDDIYIPDTGITKCYDNEKEIPCPTEERDDFFGQDAQYNSPVRQHSYTDNGDGTVTDNVTGLMWLQNDDENRRNWQDAIDYCDSLNFSNYSDWRLPNYYELSFLTDRSRLGPEMSINPVFDGHDSDYWTSSSSPSSPDDTAFQVNFRLATVSYANKITRRTYARCVRGEPMPFSYVDNGDYTVSEQTTGLMWMRETGDFDGDGWVTEDDRTNWQSALAFCQDLIYSGYDDWRLPDINELQSLVYLDAGSPSIDPAFFCVNDNYWSNSTYANPASAWYVYFRDGKTNYWSKTTTDLSLYVRCVRSGP